MNTFKLYSMLFGLAMLMVMTSSIEQTDILSGRVYNGDTGIEPPASSALSGVTVKLYGSNNAGTLGIEIGSTTTDGTGWYGLTAEVGYEFYTIVETDPPGFISVGATSVSGTKINNNQIRYSTATPLSDQTLTGNKFWDKPETPENNPPVADADGPYTATAGQQITLDGSGSTEPDAGDMITNYDWDLDDDGQYDDATGVMPQYTWNSVGTYNIVLRVTDTHGATGTDQTVVIITEAEPEDGTIIIEKHTEPMNTTEVFIFSGDINGTIGTGQQIVVGNLQPGTYTTQETLPPNWSLAEIVLSDDNSSADVTTGITTFNLEEGETIIAQYINVGHVAEEYDYGDAPDPSYPTLRSNNGARHRINPDVFLGTKIDAETDGIPNAVAEGDDNDGLDDEDGVVIQSSLIQGNPINVEVTASTGGYLNAWIDYNQNGSWNEADEHVFINTPLNAGQNNLNLNVPNEAIVGTTIARFRFSLVQGLNFDGETDDGEVEDYLIEIDEGRASEIRGVKWNDHNGNGVRDAGEPGLANWQIIMDSNQDGLLDQAPGSGDIIVLTNAMGEYTFTGSFNGTYNIGEIAQIGWNQTYPDSTNMSTTSSLSPYYHEINLTPGMTITDIDFGNQMEGSADEFDFGDAPDPSYPTLLASDGARHRINPDVFLGSSIDAETDGMPDATAVGDDNDQQDDEDGVLLPSSLIQGTSITLKVIASTSGYLNAWIDYNQNGSWIEADEHIFINSALLAGQNLLVLNVPSDALVGTTIARFRFSLAQGLSYDGEADDGEVEDYLIEIDEGGAPTGDITIIKAATPPDSSVVFNFTGDLGSFSLTPAANKITFNDLPAANYTIKEVIPAGWGLGNYQISGDLDGGTSSDSANGEFYIDLDPGENISIVIYNYRFGTIILAKQTIPSVQNDSFGFNGDFFAILKDGQTRTWQNLQPGQHRIQEDIRQGWTLTSISIDDLNSTVDLNNRTAIVNLEAGETVNVVFTNTSEDVPRGIIGDRVWHDLDQDGLQDQGEPGLANVQVSLFDNKGTLIGTSTTNSNGLYEFGNIWPGQFTLRFGLLSGYALSPQDIGVDETIDSDANQSTGETDPFNLSAGDTLLDLDAGMYFDNIIGGVRGVKWNDLNGNGLRDAGEPGIANWQIILDYNQDGILDPSPFSQDWITTTNSLGEYSYSGFFVGTYHIGEILQPGWNQTFPDSQHISHLGNVGQYEHELILSPGSILTGIDFGNIFDGTEEYYDFGDAPDPTYPTLFSNNGARHIIKPGFFLGTSVDAESDGQPNTIASGDDLDGNNDDDGVTISPVIAFGQTVPITIVALDSGVINAWIDYNINGSWADPGDQILIDQPVLAGPNSFMINVPTSNITTGLSYARFRLSSVRKLSYDGLAPDGEVEDYAIEIKAEGDDGSVVVIKEATPPDNTPFMICSQLSSSFFGISCDFLKDPLNNKLTLLNPSNIVSISEAALAGWRLDSIIITGDLDNGSAIDMTARAVTLDFDPGENIVITFKNKKIGQDIRQDFGDAPDPSYPTLLASNGARHKIKPGFYLGSAVDAEIDAQTSPNAQGDNQNIFYPGTPYPPGDEDGVLLPPILGSGQTVSTTVTASDSGVINAWVDFNIDGDWADPGEHILAALPVTPGANVFTINIPGNAKSGQSFARFRLSSIRNLNYDGPAPDGEVEDYEVFIHSGDGGNITIIKEATPADDTPFWISTVFGIHGGAAPYRDPSSNMAVITNGPPGTYFIGENIPWGWLLDDIIITGDTDMGSTKNVGNGSTQIDLDAGENIIVTFKNRKIDIADSFDFGDAPPPYPTLWADSGAYHLVDPQFKIGQYIDTEPDGLPDSDAQGDDLDNLDDEGEMVYKSGFLFYPKSTMQLAGQQTVAVLVAVDREQDGSWKNNEIVYLIYNANSSPAVIDFSKINWPIALNPGVYNVRWRVYRDLNYPASVTGFGGVGEVEDCQFTVTGDETVEYDYGDAPLPYPTQNGDPPDNHYGWRHPIVQGIHLGASVDADADGLPDARALGDDQDGLDDEDGIDFLTPFIPGSLVELGITTSVEGYLNAYIDLNQDSDWDDPNERIFIEKPMLAGSSRVSFLLPDHDILPGPTFVRFRFSSDRLYQVLPQEDLFLAIDGEVEDYEVFIEEPPSPEKWIQIPLQNVNPALAYSPYFNGWGSQSIYGDTLVADDWFCKSARPITEIHWWGSYEDWEKPFAPSNAPDAFHIGIWTDVPAEVDTPWSHPGSLIWEYIVPRTILDERVVGDVFHPEQMTDPDTCFQYDFFIPEDNWFYQEDDSTIFWLSIAAIYEEKPDSSAWGWNTRRHYFHDDAVHVYAEDAPMISDRAWHTAPVASRWDMAFVLSTDKPVLEFDFGDAPDVHYPTFFGQNGAHHLYDPRVYLGDRLDTDPDGQATADAAGDDQDGIDDDDGVTFKSMLQPGGQVDIEVKASVPGFLNAWADFYNNGQWLDPQEQIFTDQQLIAGINPLTFNFPADAIITPLYMRFRFSTESNLPMVGVAINGEVEDYYVDFSSVSSGEREYTGYKLHPNYPNPFRSSTQIYFDIPEPEVVRVAIYNLYGQEVAQVVDEHLSPGKHRVVWNGTGRGGHELAAGIYLCRMETARFVDSKKIILIR